MKQLSKEDKERIGKASIDELIKVEGTNITLWEVPDNIESREYWRETFRKGAEYEHPIARKEGFNEALEEVKKVFSPVFQIAPSAENIITIMEAFKKSFEEIEKLKR